ncbi:MAG: hypothetical protein HND58_03395 [Planctomycetota bacterium]|nr:MAG: hypothetical protein HND58_03395 [Planctomycetota bacterium]
MVMGPAVGLLAYEVTRQAGAVQFVIVFTAASVLLGLIVSVLQRRSAGLVLRDVTISIPEFSRFTFVVNDEHKRVAWILFIETASRVSTQPLSSEQGFIREALTSLHSLFGTVRDTLKTMDPSRAGRRASVEIFALGMLNAELRPFLSKWHPLLAEFEQSGAVNESEWDRRAECRKDLEFMRQRIMAYCRAFGELAGVEDVDEFFEEAVDGDEVDGAD